MSGKKQFKEQADEGFMRAMYDLQADLALGAGVEADVWLERTRRKGVYEICVEAVPNKKVWAMAGKVTYRREWPRSEVSTLAAALFQAMTAFDLLLGQAMAGPEWEAREDPWKD